MPPPLPRSVQTTYNSPVGIVFISPRFYVADNGEEDTGWSVVTLNVVPAIVDEFAAARCNVDYRGGAVMIVVSDDDLDEGPALDADDSVERYETEVAARGESRLPRCDSEEKLTRYLAAGGELIAFSGRGRDAVKTANGCRRPQSLAGRLCNHPLTSPRHGTKRGERRPGCNQ